MSAMRTRSLGLTVLATDVVIDRERVLVLAPLGRDAALAKQVAGSVGLSATVCVDARELARECRCGAGALLMTEDALSPNTIRILHELLCGQPPWSDLAVIVCATQGAFIEGALGTIEQLRTTANVSLLERPVRRWMLATALAAAVRARRRQYEMRDLYQERAAVLEREQVARANAESANRAKDEFLAMVSHELRTPLNAMLGWTKILRSRAAVDPEQQAHALEVIERNAEIQRRLVEQLIDVSRALAHEFHLAVCVVSLRGIVESAVEGIRPSVEAKSQRIECPEPLADVLVLGDPQRLTQVVSNLLGNAVKFTPPGGRIAVGLTREARWCVIEVADSGEGIAPEYLPHLFERFWQADTSRTRHHGGLGLGLAISRAIVELHGGQIEAKSDGKDRGARFVVRIPRAPREATADLMSTERKLALKPLARLKDVQVLVADDDEEARDLIAFVLRSCGLLVTTASNAREALAQLSARPFQALISDIGMPDMDGYALMKQIRMLAPEGSGGIPAIAVTAYAGSDDRQRAFEAGYDAHLAKPLDFTELLAALERVLASTP
jgi:signal transduction histidine kinase/ActR/RegA family two-component response regulator